MDAEQVTALALLDAVIAKARAEGAATMRDAAANAAHWSQTGDEAEAAIRALPIDVAGGDTRSGEQADTVLAEVRAILGAAEGESTIEAARRVVQWGEATRGVIATVTAERDALRKALDRANDLSDARRTRDTVASLGVAEIIVAKERAESDRDSLRLDLGAMTERLELRHEEHTKARHILDADVDESLCSAAARVVRDRDDARAALAAARREGEEAMRAACMEACREALRDPSDIAIIGRVADAILALPLDGDEVTL